MLGVEQLLALPNRPLDDAATATETSSEEAIVEADIDAVLASWTEASEASQRPPIMLRKRAHMAFIRKLLAKPLPAGFVAYDATRPWLLYWSLHAWTLMNYAGLDQATRIRATSTLLSCQHPQLGGFGGGPGQVPHLMGTYAAINALAIVGAPGPLPTAAECADIADPSTSTTIESLGKGGWDDIDRGKLYAWIMRLKQPDGSFTVHEGGEVDVRASYCVWCIATLTGISTPELLDGMQDFLSSCQSYEGGLASTSYPPYTASLKLDRSIPQPALGEAHGGYAFCATAAYLGLSLVSASFSIASSPRNGAPDHDGARVAGQRNSSSPSRLDLDGLVRWTVGLQCPFPSQGGGYKGRINKLVDGCYSWFSGSGMWGALESLLQLQRESEGQTTSSDYTDDSSGRSGSATAAAVPELWDRAALQLYVLLVAQHEDVQEWDDPDNGGLRDKPGKRADAYHTCYNICGLSGAQHVVRPCRETRRMCYESWQHGESAPAVDSDPSDTKTATAELRRRIYASTLGYNLAPGREKIVVGSSDNELLPTHPVLNIGFLQARAMLLWAYKQG